MDVRIEFSPCGLNWPHHFSQAPGAIRVRSADTFDQRFHAGLLLARAPAAPFRAPAHIIGDRPRYRGRTTKHRKARVGDFASVRLRRFSISASVRSTRSFISACSRSSAVVGVGSGAAAGVWAASSSARRSARHGFPVLLCPAYQGSTAKIKRFCPLHRARAPTPEDDGKRQPPRSLLTTLAV